MVNGMRRVDLHAQLDTGALCDGRDHTQCIRAGAELDAHHGKPELVGSLNLRAEVVDRLIIGHVSVAPARRVDVGPQARRGQS